MLRVGAERTKREGGGGAALGILATDKVRMADLAKTGDRVLTWAVSARGGMQGGEASRGIAGGRAQASIGARVTRDVSRGLEAKKDSRRLSIGKTISMALRKLAS